MALEADMDTRAQPKAAEIAAAFYGEGGETRAQWEWAELLAALDSKGYAIVRKPELLDKGLPSPRK